MAFTKQANRNFLTIFLILIFSPSHSIATINIDCEGKAFHCVNSTHFKICVDFGGVSKTVDNFLIPCPEGTVCTSNNYFECEFQITTTPVFISKQSDVTNEQFKTTGAPTLDALDVTIHNDAKKMKLTELLENYYTDVNTVTEVNSFVTSTETTDHLSLLSTFTPQNEVINYLPSKRTNEINNISDSKISESENSNFSLKNVEKINPHTSDNNSSTDVITQSVIANESVSSTDLNDYITVKHSNNVLNKHHYDTTTSTEGSSSPSQFLTESWHRSTIYTDSNNQETDVALDFNIYNKVLKSNSINNNSSIYKGENFNGTDTNSSVATAIKNKMIKKADDYNNVAADTSTIIISLLTESLNTNKEDLIYNTVDTVNSYKDYTTMTAESSPESQDFRVITAESSSKSLPTSQYQNMGTNDYVSDKSLVSTIEYNDAIIQSSTNVGTGENILENSENKIYLYLTNTEYPITVPTNNISITHTTYKYTVPFSSAKNILKSAVQEFIDGEYNVNVNTVSDLASNVSMQTYDVRTYSYKPLLGQIQNTFNLDTQQTTKSSAISTNTFDTDVINDVTVPTLSTSSDDSYYSNYEVSTKVSYLLSENDVTEVSLQEEQNSIRMDMFDSRATSNTIFDLSETTPVFDWNNYNRIQLNDTLERNIASNNYLDTLILPIENHSYTNSETAKPQPIMDALGLHFITEPFYSTAKHDNVDETSVVNTETSTRLLAQKNYKIRSLPKPISSPLLKLDNDTASLFNYSNITDSNLTATKEVPMQLLDFSTIPTSSSISSFVQESFTNAERDSIAALNNFKETTEKPYNSLDHELISDKYGVINEQNYVVDVRTAPISKSNINKHLTTKKEVLSETEINIPLTNDSFDGNTYEPPILAQIDRPPEEKHNYNNLSFSVKKLEPSTQVEDDILPLRNPKNFVVDTSYDTENLYTTTGIRMNINNNNSETELINISKNIYPLNNKETLSHDNLLSSLTTNNINKLGESIQKELNNDDSLTASKYTDQFAYTEVVNSINHDNLEINKSNKDHSINNNDGSTTVTEKVHIQSLSNLAVVYLPHGDFVGNRLTTPTTREIRLNLNLNKTEDISKQDYSNIINDPISTVDKNPTNVQSHKIDSVLSISRKDTTASLDSSAKNGHSTLKLNPLDIIFNPNNLDHSDAVTLKDVKTDTNYENIGDKINILNNNRPSDSHRLGNETLDTHADELTILNTLTSKNMTNKPFQATVTHSLKEGDIKSYVNNVTKENYVDETIMSEKNSYNENFDFSTSRNAFQPNREYRLGSLQQNIASQSLTYNMPRDNASNNSVTTSKNGTPTTDKIGNENLKALNAHSFELTTANMLTSKNIMNKSFKTKEIKNSLGEGERKTLNINEKHLYKSNMPGKLIYNENLDFNIFHETTRLPDSSNISLSQPSKDFKLGSIKQSEASQSITNNIPKDNLYNTSHNSVAIANNRTLLHKIGENVISEVKKNKINPNSLLNISYSSENSTNKMFTLDINSKNISNNAISNAKKSFISLDKLEVKVNNATSNNTRIVKVVQTLHRLPTEKKNSDLIGSVAPFNKLKKSNNFNSSNNINVSKSDLISNRDVKNNSIISLTAVKKTSTGILKDQNYTQSIKVYDVRKNYSSALEIRQINSSELPFSCKGHTGKYSDKEDCSKFYICYGKNAPIIGRCPYKTVFSEFKKQCTKNLSHCVRNNQFQCISNGHYLDVLSDQFYYICIKKAGHFVRFKLKCQKGYYLERTGIRCISLNTFVSNEDSSDITKDRSTIESTFDENKDLKVKRQDFECEVEGKFPHPDDSRKYYTCIKNSKSEFRRKTKKCDSDEVFHKERKECVDGDSDE